MLGGCQLNSSGKRVDLIYNCFSSVNLFQMNRISSHHKYILKDGKYTVQQPPQGEIQSYRARSDAANSLESGKHTNIRTMDGNPKVYHSTRPVLANEMTSSAIYPRRVEVVSKPLESRRFGQNFVGSVEHSPIKLIETDRQPQLGQAAKQLKVAFQTMRCDAKSNNSQEEINQTEAGNLTTLEAQTNLEGRNIDQLGFEDKVLELTMVNRELTEKLRYFHRRELEQKYRMSPQQEIVWLKRTLEDRSTEFEKALNQNKRLQGEVVFLKERILSLQRSNHILEIENARNKGQLFTEDELIQICCPEQSRGAFAGKDKNIVNLQSQIQSLKGQLQKLQADSAKPTSDTRSQIVSSHNTHKASPLQEKISNLKKHIMERSNVLDALKYGSEKKETLMKYIANIVERLGAEEKNIDQLKNEVKGKETIILEMDGLVTNLSEQLAACKKDLSKQFEIQDSFHQMRQSMMTQATSIHEPTKKEPSSLTNSRFDGYCESPPKQSIRAVRLSEDVFASRLFDTSPEKRRPVEKIETEVVEDSEHIIKVLEKECSEKQRQIQRYQLEVVRLNKMLGTQLGIPPSALQNDRRLLLTEHETDYAPTIHQISSSLKLKKKTIGGQNSKTSIISIKRASIV